MDSTGVTPTIAETNNEASEDRLMEQYDSARKRYFVTLRVCEGCGARTDSTVQKSYDEMAVAYAAAPEGKRGTLPRLQLSKNDGTDGMGSGLVSAAQGCAQQ